METRALLFFGKDKMWDRDYMYECDVAKIVTYMRKRPKHKLLKAEAHSEWALNEILNRVLDETQKLPYHISGLEPEPVKDIIREFIEEMTYYSSIASTAEVIFFVEMAKGEAEKLLVKFE